LTAQTQPSRFALEALILAALLLGLQGLSVVLQTDRGRGLFVEEGFGQDLTERAGGGLAPSESGLLLDPGQSASRGLVKLRPLSLETGRSYLIVVAAGPGGHLTFEGTDELSGQRVFHRLRQRTVPADYQFGLTLEDESGPGEREFVLWIRNHGAAPLEVSRLELHRLGRAHGFLLASTPWVMMLLAAGFVCRYRRQLLSALREPSRAEDIFFAAAVFVVFLLIFRVAPVDQVMDSRYTTAVSRALVRTGSLALPLDEEPGRYGRLPYQLQRVGNDVRHFYPAAPAILNAPVVAAYMALGISPVDERGEYLPVVEMRILAMLAALQAAALCAVLYLLARRFVDPRWALATVALFGLGTQIFSTISRSYWTHAWATLLLSLGLLMMTSARVRSSRSGMAALATILSWGFFCRPTLALAILGITMVLFRSHRDSRLGWYAATGAAWAGLFLARSMALFGTVLPPYFGVAHYAGELSETSPGWSSYPEAVLGTLLSPSRGLFIYVPLFLWILCMAAVHRRHLGRRDLALCSGIVVIAHWQLVSLSAAWYGGLAFGPRLFSDLVPWFFLLTVLLIQSLASGGRSQRFLMSAWQPVLLTLVLMFSIFVNTRGAFSQDTVRWNPKEIAKTLPDPESGFQPAGIWSWRYPQFLAGLQSPPATEDR
jgi:hypothetical protein